MSTCFERSLYIQSCALMCVDNNYIIVVIAMYGHFDFKMLTVIVFHVHGNLLILATNIKKQ